VQAESGAPILPVREVRAAHEVLVYKPVVGDVLPNTQYDVTGMALALGLQVTKYTSARSSLVLSGRETALSQREAVAGASACCRYSSP
jgi:hypothetical protein